MYNPDQMQRVPSRFSIYAGAGFITMDQSKRDHFQTDPLISIFQRFRSEKGAQEYLTIMSYIGSARKHGINAFTAIREALNGTPDIIFN